MIKNKILRLLLKNLGVFFNKKSNENKGINFINVIDKKGVKVYLLYITYKVQVSLYEICKKGDEKLTWEDLIYCVRGYEDLRSIIKLVVYHAMKGFSISSFNCNINVNDLRKIKKNEKKEFEIYGNNDMIHMSKIFDDEEGENLVKTFILKAEMAHYTYLSNYRRDYTIERYFIELILNKTMRNSLMLIIHDAISRIDFTSSWESEGLIEKELKNFFKNISSEFI